MEPTEKGTIFLALESTEPVAGKPPSLFCGSKVQYFTAAASWGVACKQMRHFCHLRCRFADVDPLENAQAAKLLWLFASTW